MNPSLHLVYLCGEYPPASHGGIGTFTRAMAHAMVARGHTVTVLGVQRGLGAVRDERSAPASLSGGPHERTGQETLVTNPGNWQHAEKSGDSRANPLWPCAFEAFWGEEARFRRPHGLGLEVSGPFP